MAKKPTPMLDPQLKVEAKKVATQLIAAGFDVFSAGYGRVLVRLQAADPGYTAMLTDDARKLLAK